MSVAPIPAMQNEPARRPRVDQAESIDYQVTASFVALLEQLGCSLVITNYQSSTVMTFSSLGDGKPVHMFAPFRAAMGLAIDGGRFAVAAHESHPEADAPIAPRANGSTPSR